MYVYTTFDTLAVPPYNQEADHGSGRAESAIRATIGGAVDVYGATATPIRRREITVRGIIAGEDPGLILWEPGGALLETEAGDRMAWLLSSGEEAAAIVAAWRAMVGRRGTLTRRDLATQQTTAGQARLLEVRHQTRIEDRATIATLELTFETLGNPFA